MTRFGLSFEYENPKCASNNECPALKSIQNIPSVRVAVTTDGTVQISCTERFYQMTQHQLNVACENCVLRQK